MRRPETAILAALALAGCKARTHAEDADAATPAPSLVGAWRTEAPVRYLGEGLRTEGEGRTEYRPDGRFLYTGRLTVQGEKLPPDGLSFRVKGEGRWTLADRTLTERYTAVRVAPELPDRNIDRLAGQLGREMLDQAPSVSRVDLTAGRLTLRDRDSGQEARYVRAD